MADIEDSYERVKMFDFRTAKEDDRPQRGGWAPGNYGRECMRCGDSFIGDKRAWVCADCAYAEEEEDDEKDEDETKPTWEQFSMAMKGLLQLVSKEFKWVTVDRACVNRGNAAISYWRVEPTEGLSGWECDREDRNCGHMCFLAESLLPDGFDHKMAKWKRPDKKQRYEWKANRTSKRCQSCVNYERGNVYNHPIRNYGGCARQKFGVSASSLGCECYEERVK